jgi:hypothetical protein
MKCAVCVNQQKNQAYFLSEMMFGLKDQFKYFECAVCGCFQIETIPIDMEKYYPDNYYSLNSSGGGSLN